MPIHQLLASRAFRIAAASLVAVGLYALLGFQLAPRIVRDQAISFVREQYARELRIGAVRINPFRLDLELRDVALPDADGQTMLGFSRLLVDLELGSSLWQRAAAFRAVVLEAPTARVVVRPDGRVNLADLAPKNASPRPEEEEEGLPTLWIESLAVSEGTVDFVDRARRKPLERRFAPVAFTLTDFRTTPEGGGFGLTASNDAGERFRWNGRVALEPRIASEGDFSISALKAPGLGELFFETRPVRLTRGVLDLAGSYRAALTPDGFELDVRLPQIALSDASARAQSADADWVQLASLTLSSTHVALPANAVTVDRIALQGLRVQAWRAADGTLNVMQLAGMPGGEAAEAVAPAAGEAPTKPEAASVPAPSAWKLDVGRVELSDAALDVEDRSLAPPARLALAPLHATASGVSLDLAKPVPIRFDVGLNGGGRLVGSGSVTPSPLAADLELDLADFALRDVQPYVSRASALTLADGRLAVKGKLALAPPGGAEGRVRFAGDVRVDGFRALARGQDLLAFEQLELARIDYRAEPAALQIDEIRLSAPVGRVSIGADQVLNVAAALEPEGAARTGAGRAEPAPPPPRAPEPAAGDMPIRIGAVRIARGQMAFSDLSIQPNFAADISDLRGSVTGLSSDARACAKLRLEGRVGEFSPVTIAGELRPFAFDRSSDIRLKFENISLPIFNPYSGRHAGYSIAQGKLTTELHYTIQERQLEAAHHIRLDQLEWGEATAEKSEASLPVKFATSLLKDADGVIELDIPVSGTLDDPSFRIGPIVWQVIKNLITKAVTAPFKALGALFAGAEEAQFVDFAPGASDLDAAARERLGQLGKALAPKADIRVSVPIGVLAELDAPALAEQRYVAERDAVMAETLRRRRASDEPLPAFEALEPARRVAVLETLLEQLTGARPELPEPPPAPEGSSRKEARALRDAAALAHLEAQAKDRLAPDPTHLERLAEARAAAVERALLADTGLAAERVFLVRNDKLAARAGRVRLELGME
jgi:uncharacterized protein involved in outer membrane biogenesis